MVTKADSSYTYPTYLSVGKPEMEQSGCLTEFLFKKLYPLAFSKDAQRQLGKEKGDNRAYWLDQPISDVYFKHAAVQKTFHPPVCSTCEIVLTNHKRLTVQFSVIESRPKEKEMRYVTLAYMGGILTTAGSTTASLHPYLAFYSDRQKKEKDLPGLRIISLSVNDIFNKQGQQYLPFLRTGGEITYRTHLKLQDRYGTIKWYGHSLGAVFVAEALPHFTKEDTPPVMCLDRGFTSLRAASYNDLGCLACCAYPAAASLGFDSNPAVRVGYS